MNSQSSTFKLKTSGNYDQLMSQKQRLTNNAKYLAVTRGASGALMLTSLHNNKNRFQILE